MTLRIAGLELTMFSAGPMFELNEAFSLLESVETQEKVDHFWGKLVEGGAENQCGWLRDKFGVSWQIVPSLQMRTAFGGGRASARFEGDVRHAT